MGARAAFRQAVPRPLDERCPRRRSRIRRAPREESWLASQTCMVNAGARETRYGEQTAEACVRRADGRSEEDMATFKRLAMQYHEWLNEDLCFQSFDQEMASLPRPYSEPDGFILLAELGGEVAGCVALKPLPAAIGTGEARVCEMKRLFVPGKFRGRGIGKLLVKSCIDLARGLGLYDLMVLDTLERLSAANAVYAQAGFTTRGPYYGNPLAGVLYYELAIADAS